MPHICVSESCQHWFRWWLTAHSAPSHYQTQCFDIVNWTLRSKRHWNFNQNTKLFIYENASENIVCEMVVILSRQKDELRMRPSPFCNLLGYKIAIHGNYVGPGALNLFHWICTNQNAMRFELTVSVTREYSYSCGKWIGHKTKDARMSSLLVTFWTSVCEICMPSRTMTMINSILAR